MKHLSSSEKYITEELTQIDLEILLSESRVESESTLIEIDVRDEKFITARDLYDIENKFKGNIQKKYIVVDLSVGNSMTLRLDGMNILRNRIRFIIF